MNPILQEWIALSIVALVALRVFVAFVRAFWGERIALQVARRGHVKLAMRIRGT